MGFLDILKKITDTALNSKPTEAKSASKPQNTAKKPAPTLKTPQEIVESGNTPPKSPFLHKDEFGDKEYSFMISGDFVEFNSHCEVMPSFQYEPFNDDDYTEYNELLPIIGIGPNDDIYCAVEEYEENGTLPDENYEECDSEYFAFRCSFKAYNRKYYAYGFRSNTARELEMLSVDYLPDIEGTPLENKLKAALDEIALSYSENTMN